MNNDIRIDITEFAPLDCEFIHRGIQDGYPFTGMDEGWIMDLWDIVDASKFRVVKLNFFFYLFMYEKYGNIEWGDESSSIRSVRSRYAGYLINGGKDMAYYRGVMGI